MRKRNIPVKKILIVSGALLVLIQLIRIDKSNPASDPASDFITATAATPEVASLLKASCYDCHSNESTYPWYTNIAPVSWWIKHHIDEGRGELNFSEWEGYSWRRKDDKLEECVEMIEEGEMPMSSYTLVHKEAELNAEQKAKLTAFFNSLRTHESDQK